MTDLGSDVWSRLLTQLDDPPVGTVAEALADARDLEVGTAYDAVEGAIDAGVLVEEDISGAFDAVRFAEDDETAEPSGAGDRNAEEPILSATTPRRDRQDRGRHVGRPRLFRDRSQDVGARQIERDAWMCRKETKAPYAPWADTDAPVECNHEDHGEATTCAECSHHAGYKWGSDGSREHVHADHDTAREWADMVPSLSSDPVYIQGEADPFAFVDGSYS